MQNSSQANLVENIPLAFESKPLNLFPYCYIILDFSKIFRASNGLSPITIHNDITNSRLLTKAFVMENPFSILFNERYKRMPIIKPKRGVHTIANKHFEFTFKLFS